MAVGLSQCGNLTFYGVRSLNMRYFLSAWPQMPYGTCVQSPTTLAPGYSCSVIIVRSSNRKWQRWIFLIIFSLKESRILAKHSAGQHTPDHRLLRQFYIAKLSSSWQFHLKLS